MIEPTEEQIDAARPFFSALELNIRDYQQLREHFTNSDVDLSIFPEWVRTDNGHITKSAAASIVWYMMTSMLSATPKNIPEGYKLLKDTTLSDRSWPDDASHENGNYQNECFVCLRSFTGHKRRVVCRVCASET